MMYHITGAKLTLFLKIALTGQSLDNTLAVGIDVHASLSNWEMNPGYRQGPVIG